MLAFVLKWIVIETLDFFLNNRPPTAPLSNTWVTVKPVGSPERTNGVTAAGTPPLQAVHQELPGWVMVSGFSVAIVLHWGGGCVCGGRRGLPTRTTTSISASRQGLEGIVHFLYVYPLPPSLPIDWQHCERLDGCGAHQYASDNYRDVLSAIQYVLMYLPTTGIRQHGSILGLILEPSFN